MDTIPDEEVNRLFELLIIQECESIREVWDLPNLPLPVRLTTCVIFHFWANWMNGIMDAGEPLPDEIMPTSPADSLTSIWAAARQAGEATEGTYNMLMVVLSAAAADCVPPFELWEHTRKASGRVKLAVMDGCDETGRPDPQAVADKLASGDIWPEEL